MQVLKSHFDGRPITKQNLSDWRLGGFQDWLKQRESLALATSFLEEAADYAGLAASGPTLADRLAALSAVAVGQIFQAAIHAPAGSEQASQIITAVRELSRLRQAGLASAEAARTQADWQRQQDEFARQDRHAKLLARLKAAEQRESEISYLNSTEDYYNVDVLRAWYRAGVEHGLPNDEWYPPRVKAPAPKPASRAAKSAARATKIAGSNPTPVSSNPSNPVKPPSVASSLPLTAPPPSITPAPPPPVAVPLPPAPAISASIASTAPASPTPAANHPAISSSASAPLKPAQDLIKPAPAKLKQLVPTPSIYPSSIANVSDATRYAPSGEWPPIDSNVTPAGHPQSNPVVPSRA